MKTRFFTLWVALLCLPMICWGQSPTYGGGDGTEATPYQISTAEHLKALVEAVNGGESYDNVYFQLTASLTITDNSWKPIGDDDENPFSGTFDGGGNTLTLPESLFDYVTNGKVSNLTVSITATNTNINGIVAAYVNNSVIENVTSEGSLSSGRTSNQAGGLFYMVKNGSQILNCTNNATLSGYNIAGGIAWCMDSREGETTTLIDGCTNNGDITTSNSWNGWAGGIIGSMYGGTISNCTNNGNISSVVQAAGGVVGCAFDYNFTESSSEPPAQDMLFINNTNTGEVDCVQAAGGIIGLADSNWNDIYVINCLNIGAISGGALISGIAGIAQTVRGGDSTNPANEDNEDTIIIQNCGNTGKITINGGEGAPGASIAVMDGSGKEQASDNVYIEQEGLPGILTGEPNDGDDVKEPTKVADQADLLDKLNEGAKEYNKNNPNIPAKGWNVIDGEIVSTLLPPVIEGTTPFEESTTITIIADDDATIYYTIDGTDPTIVSTQYSEAFNITETTTIKAIAIKNDEVSAITEMQFVLLEPEDPSTPTVPDYPDYYNIYIETCDGIEATLSTKVVREGNSMSFTLETKEGYMDENLSVKFKRSMFGYWETATPDENGVYQIRNIYTDIYIQVEGIEEESPTGIETLEGIQVYTQGGSIFVYTPQQEQVMIISMGGAIIKNEMQVGLKQYTGLQRGIYIICIGEDKTKIKI